MESLEISECLRNVAFLENLAVFGLQGRWGCGGRCLGKEHTVITDLHGSSRRPLAIISPQWPS